MSALRAAGIPESSILRSPAAFVAWRKSMGWPDYAWPTYTPPARALPVWVCGGAAGCQCPRLTT